MSLCNKIFRSSQCNVPYILSVRAPLIQMYPVNTLWFWIPLLIAIIGVQAFGTIRQVYIEGA